jgi:hypothetical protein
MNQAPGLLYSKEESFTNWIHGKILAECEKFSKGIIKVLITKRQLMYPLEEKDLLN